MDWRGLLAGELRLTFDILLGLAVGAAVLKTGLADMLMKRLLPLLRRAGIGPVLGMALTISLGSAKAGAAFIASAVDGGRLAERPAKWGTLMLSFPAYLHRWPSTMIMASSMAGVAGAIFALTLLLRSAARFVMLIFILKRGEHEAGMIDEASVPSAGGVKFDYRKLLRTMPLAWVFYAAAYALVPWAENALKEWLLGGAAFLPLAGLTVAAASIAHVSAALALAGGSLAAGDLSVAQAVFALLFGNSLGIVTRLFRANAGYYFGLFPKATAKWLLFWNFATTASFAAATLLLAALPLAAAAAR